MTLVVNRLQATSFPAASDVWKVLVSNDTPEFDQSSLSRRDVEQLDDDVLQTLADVFNLPRRQLADASARHTEL